MSRATSGRRAWPGWPGAVGLLALAAALACAGLLLWLHPALAARRNGL